MPAGISNSAVNPAALTGVSAAGLAAGGQEVVRAPEAGTGNQRC
jgi:hypothetical protein